MNYHSNQIEKKEIDREFNDHQNFCINCKNPINTNSNISNKMKSICKKCFNFKYREDEKRKINKNITKDRKNQRKYKHQY